MAYTKKTPTKTEETKDTEVISATLESIIDGEKEALKSQLAEQQSQFEQLKAQMDLMMKAMSNATQTPVETVKKERNIPFINLTTGKVVLKGSAYWEIDGQFKKRNFLEREARMILNNTPNLIHSGGVYIADARFVEDNDLSEIYQNILTDTQIKELFNQDANDIIEAYKSASDGQKDIIINLIVDKRVKGEEVDANILMKLGKLCNRNLMEIEPLNETEE